MIKLYWWNDEPNFGDEASYYIISKLFGATKWSNPCILLRKELRLFFSCLIHGKHYNIKRLKGYCLPWQKAIMSIGSILDFSSYKTLIWGSGFREPTSVFCGGKVFAVRGKLTLEKIPKNALVRNVAIGDPGLLLPMVYNPHLSKNEQVSIVPHFSEYEFFKKTYDNRYNIINVKTRDVEAVVNQIVVSKYVLSTSLHGIIIAHAYGIPAIWIKHGWIHSSDFKFHDYFSGVGIKQYEPFCAKEILYDYDGIDNFFDRNSDIKLPNNLEPIQSALIDSFPIKNKNY